MKAVAAFTVMCAAAVPWVQSRIDDRLGPFQAQQDVLYVWSGDHVRKMLPGFEAVMADIYWLRTVQYFGAQHVFARESRYELLEPLTDITTTLDPHFELAYRYGAVFLAEPWPQGAGKPDRAVALLEKGVRENPSSWRLRLDLGLLHFFFLHDAQRAAAILTEASTLPGAAPWLEAMAADVLYRAGERATSRTIWMRLYEQSEGNMKDNADFHLKRLDALDGVDALEERVRIYESRLGKKPASLGDLLSAGLVRAFPRDPLGVPFDYDPATGRVSISRQSGLWRQQ